MKTKFNTPPLYVINNYISCKKYLLRIFKVMCLSILLISSVSTQCPSETFIIEALENGSPTDCPRTFQLVGTYVGNPTNIDIQLQVTLSGYLDYAIECRHPQVNCTQWNNTINIVGQNILSTSLAEIAIVTVQQDPNDCIDFVSMVGTIVVNGVVCPITSSAIIPCPTYSAVCPVIGLAADPEGCTIDDAPLVSSCSPTSDGTGCVSVPEGGCVDIELDGCVCDPEMVIDPRDPKIIREVVLDIRDVFENPYGGLLGDVNGSNNVSTLDIILIETYLLDPDNYEGPVGTCILFHPPNVENGDEVGGFNFVDEPYVYCDGDPTPHLLTGVIGDANGTCDCDFVELQDEEPEYEFSAYFTLKTSSRGTDIVANEDISFYDATFAFNNPEVLDVNYLDTKGLTYSAYNTKAVSALIMSSETQRPLSYKKGQIISSFSNRNLQVNEEKSFMINSNLDIVKMDSSKSNPRNSNVDVIEAIQCYSTNDNIIMVEQLNVQKVYHIEVYNIQGQRISNYSGVNGSQNFKIPFSGLNESIVFVVITDDLGGQSIFKIII